MIQPDRLTDLMKLPALKGASLAIITAILLAGTPLTNQELMAFTNYGSDTIQKATKKLAIFQIIVQTSGRYGGWSLTGSAWTQIPLGLRGIKDAHYEGYEQLGSPKKSDSPMLTFGGSLKKSDSNHEKSDSSPKKSDSRPIVITTTNDLSNNDDLVVTNLYGESSPKKSDSRYPDDSVEHWLFIGGIGPTSIKWQQIINMNHQPDYVKAHALERLYQMKVYEAGKGSVKEFRVGLLIIRLEQRQRAPQMRCTSCLETEKACRCKANSAQYTPPAGFRLHNSKLVPEFWDDDDEDDEDLEN